MAFPEVGARLILENQRGFLSGFRSANDAVKSFGSSADGVKASTIAMGNIMADVATGAARLLANAIGDVTKAAAGFLAGSVGMAADLEAQMSGVQAVLGASNDELELLNDLVVDLGIDPNLKVSSLEAAEAIEVLAKNGISTTDILDGAARSTVLLSNATGSDFKTAADVATDAMIVFNRQANDLGGVVNGVAAVLQNSKFDVNDYRLAIANGGSAAEAAGVSLEQFNTLITAVSSNFSSGMTAGTNFKVFLQRLQNPTDEAAEAMRMLGVRVFDADGNMRDIFDIIGDFNSALNGTVSVTTEAGGRTAEQNARLQDLRTQYQNTVGALADYDAGIRGIAESEEGKIVSVDRLQRKQAALAAEIAGLEAIQGQQITTTRQLTEEQKAQAINTIFMGEASQFARAIFDESAASLQTLNDKLGQVDAEEAARIRVDNFRGAMEILSGVIEAIRLEIGGAFLPILTDLARQLSGLVEQNSAPIIAFFQQASQFISTFVQALLDGQGPIASFTTAMAAVGVPQETIDQFNSFVSTVQDIINVVSSFVTEHSEALKGALIGIGAVLAGAAIAAGIAAIGSAIAALASPIGIIIIAAGALGAAWSENWGDIQGKTKAVIEFLTPHLEAIRDWLAVNIPVAVQTASDFWTNTLQPALSDFAQFVKSDVIPTISNIVDWLQVNVPIAIQAASDFWTNTLQPAFQEISDFITDFLVPAFQEVAAFIEDPVIPLLAAIGDLINAVILVAVEALAGAWQNILLPAIEAVAGFLAATFLPIFEKLDEKFNLSKNATKSYEEAIDKLRQTFEKIKGILGGVISKIEGFTAKVKDFKLPDILTPGSPTPFEIALRGIADAMEQVNKSAVGLASLGYVLGENLLPGATSSKSFLTTIENLLGRAGTIAKLGGGFAAAFERQTVKPLEEEMKRLGDVVGGREKILADLLGVKPDEISGLLPKLSLQAAKAQQQINAIANAEAAVARARQTIQSFFGMSIEELIQQAGGLDSLLGLGEIQDFLAATQALQEAQQSTFNTGIFAGNQQAINALNGLTTAQNNLGQATESYRQEQEKLLSLEQKRQDLAFLQTQLDLIEFVRDKALDKSILEGITFGLDADAAGLLDAMTRATTALIDRASENLGIASESKVFKYFGRMIDAGLVSGIEGGASAISRAMSSVISPPATGQQIIQRANNSQIQNVFNMGNNTINSGMDAATLDAMVQRAVARAI